jgi:tRNA threonylcarbamoyladenosine biosynthesis protein TsaE
VTSSATTLHVEFTSDGAPHTQLLGERLGRLLRSGDVVCLQGDLGAGKTCLAQGIARGLGVSAGVASPTFIIINEYRLPGASYRLRHIDLYRIESVAEARALGLEDYLYGDGICVIEWPERVSELLPRERLWVTLRYLNDTRRQLKLDALGQRYEQLLTALSQETSAA